MKAEHRKELQTNVLADRMGRLVQGMRSGGQSTSAVAWFLIVLAVGVFLAWYFASGPSAQSAAWVKLYEDTNPEDLENAAKSEPGTLPWRTAQFQQARIALQEGLENIYSERRSTAIKDLVNARRLYEELRPQCVDAPLLVQETLLGEAKAEEGLVGVPKDDNSREGLGDLNRALGLYQQYLQALEKTDPDSPLYQSVRQHVEELQKDPKKVEEFYANMNRIAAEKGKKKNRAAEETPVP
jgi:hypothetical protein